ncbi:histone-lysine N-methyltransferase NSD2-like isoform X2 [Haliotis rufescens]|uniref:histone-lysine N-methyltransferase NSD2-like isoform X2 n=1 Tax=Haliotis rufescens TaxID=6454 RepID=UPI00201EC6D9|nr:histone-lysine N-methyltransferase NSD2-like isoform X2 [Haliotis rufescens]
MSVEAKTPSVVNGITPQAGAGAGFHHHLPQIPTVNKNPKIAQSKASVKNPVNAPEKEDPQTVNIVQVSEEAKQDKSESAAKPQDKPADTPAEAAEKPDEKPKEVIRQPPKKSRQSYELAAQETSVASREKRQIKKKVPKDELFASEKPQKTPKAETAVTPKAQAPSEDASGCPSKYLVGDLLWAKVSGHPFWPCMVSYDPFISIFTRVRVTVKQKALRSYHVQFFGDEAERGWINESSAIPFEGKERFFKRAENLIENAPKTMKGKFMQMYKVNTTRRPAWEVGVAAAEEAYNLERNERKQQFTFVYEIPASKLPKTSKTPDSKKDEKALKQKRGRKRKQPEEDEELPEQASPTSKKRKVSDVETTKSPTVPHKVTKYEGSFESFCHKHRDGVLDDHPDYDDEQVVEYLHQQWNMMTKEQKARYTSKYTGADTEEKPTPGNSAKRSPRVSRPSVKKLEAEEGNKLFCEIVAKKQKKSPRERKGERSSGRPVRETRRVIKMELEEAEAEAEPEVKAAPASEVIAAAPEEEKKEESGPPPAPVEPVKSRRGHKTEVVSNGSEEAAVKMEVEAPAPAAVPVPEGKRKRASRVKVECQGHSSDSGSDTQVDIKPIKTLKMPKDVDPDLDLEIFKLNASDNTKREPICLICEDVGNLVECTGPCQGHFHVDCLGLGHEPAGDFKCDECQSGTHVCFSCKKSDGEVRRCSVSQCGRFYHEECVVKYPQSHVEGKKFTCPLHACATCVSENNKNPKAAKGRLYRCVRCPTAYHVGDFCIAAGSKNLAGLNIVCSNHFQPKKSQAHHSHVNVSWCFICSQGGTLLCCESCPAAFHAQCLKIDFPQGSWYCHTCRSGKKPLYGDIIWVKLGNYRWWPGEICHPRNVPTNIQEKPHDVGEFPVKFLGSRDYFWLYQGRVFLFQEGDKGSRDSTTKGIAKIFSKGVKEATEAFKIWRQAKENREQMEQERNDKKPAPFKFVKANVPIGNVIVHKAELANIPRCECTPDMPNPCTPEANCLNTILMYECHPTTCPAGDKCQNQRFQKRQYPESTSFKTSSRGWGLKTLQDVKKGQFVNEYVGDLIDEEECKRRIKQAHEDNISNFYMLTLDKNRIIDACPKGNLSRFMNHSCSPNCETQKWTVNGDIRVGLFALKDVPAGSELTFNYNLDCLGNDKKTCGCGAANCSGFLGVRPKTAAAVANEKRSKEQQKKKRKRKKMEVKKEHEDECFRCGEGGELVMCDKPNCPKSYHLQCLNLAKPPHGKWLCPWHHCDICGKVARKVCSECPNSFCNGHIEDNIFNVEGALVCSDHGDILEGKTCGPVDNMSETSASDSYVDAASVKDEKDFACVKDFEGEEMDTSVKSEKENSVKENSISESVLKESDNKTPVPHPAKSGLTVERKPPVGNYPRNLPQQQEKRKYKTVVNSARKANIRAKLPTENDNGQKDDKSTIPKANSGNSKGRGRPKKNSGNALPDTNIKDGLPVAPLFDDSDDEHFNLVIDIPKF